MAPSTQLVKAKIPSSLSHLETIHHYTCLLHLVHRYVQACSCLSTPHSLVRTPLLFSELLQRSGLSIPTAALPPLHSVLSLKLSISFPRSEDKHCDPKCACPVLCLSFSPSFSPARPLFTFRPRGLSFPRFPQKCLTPFPAGPSYAIPTPRKSVAILSYHHSPSDFSSNATSSGRLL